MAYQQRTPFKKRPNVTDETVLSYKNVDLIKHFVSEQGYIVARDKTGLSQKQQRHLTRAIKQARHLAMLPFTQTI